MKLTTFLLVALMQIAAAAHQPTAIAAEIVVVPSGALQLKGLLWLPENGGPFPAVLFNHGSGSSDAMHTGPFVVIEAAQRLGLIFVKHGFAFLYLFRRGQGLSADQGDFMQELLQHEKLANREEGTRRWIAGRSTSLNSWMRMSVDCDRRLLICMQKETENEIHSAIFSFLLLNS